MSMSNLKEDTNMSSLKDHRKHQRMRLFAEAPRAGVVKNTVEPVPCSHNTKKIIFTFQQLGHQHI